jgi:transcription termination factor Rho
VDIVDLKQKSVTELQALAADLNVENTSGLRKQDLIFRIEQSLLDQDIVLRSEGVLEILTEGYGFLRSQDWSYLHGPDDIYVSPSQIKRFDLRTGDTIRGEVRPPKQWERYLALLKVDTINGDEPDPSKARLIFENLKPRYPISGCASRTRPQHARRRSRCSIGKGPARADRRPAAHRQDDPSAEDGERHFDEPSRGQAHRAAHR